jgi:hypothetical protein
MEIFNRKGRKETREVRKEIQDNNRFLPAWRLNSFGSG